MKFLFPFISFTVSTLIYGLLLQKNKQANRRLRPHIPKASYYNIIQGQYQFCWVEQCPIYSAWPPVFIRNKKLARHSVRNNNFESGEMDSATFRTPRAATEAERPTLHATHSINLHSWHLLFQSSVMAVWPLHLDSYIYVTDSTRASYSKLFTYLAPSRTYEMSERFYNLSWMKIK